MEDLFIPIGIVLVTRAQLHRAAKHEIVALIKTELPNKFPHDFLDKQTTAEYQ